MYEARIRLSKTLGLPLQAASAEAAAVEARAAAAHVASPGDEIEIEIVQIVDRISGTTVVNQDGLPPDGMVDVSWAVRVPAGTALEGACVARFMQFDPSSLAAVYRVREPSGRTHVIDLQDTASAAH
ncbi:MAG: hypothetical protein HYX47_13075 [Burkholderiales bacterium]|nr:hypothetical protein [Burkholderiales bacterium]